MSWRQKKQNRRRRATQQSDRRLSWRLPKLLGPVQRRVLRFSVLAMITLASGWQLQDWLAGADILTLRQVRVEGSFKHVSRAKVQAILAPFVDKHFFDLDVAEIKQVFQQLPWVKQVTVRRQWPDVLEITLLEQQAVARWGERGLLNADADVFFPAGGVPADVAMLPSLKGVAHSQQMMLARWQDMGALLRPLDLKIVAVTLDERRSWWIKLDNGLRLMLGKEQDMQRMKRFVAFYPSLLAAQAAEVGVVDLRYPNGIALRWRS